MLWNIDSQDWNRRLSGKQIAHRVEALMLLGRRGTVLFHDIHPRALATMERLQSLVRANNQKWIDCRKMATSLVQ